MREPKQNGSLPVFHLQPEEDGRAGPVPDSLQHGLRRQRVHRRHFQNGVSAGQNQSSDLGWDGKVALYFLCFVLWFWGVGVCVCVCVSPAPLLCTSAQLGGGREARASCQLFPGFLL